MAGLFVLQWWFLTAFIFNAAAMFILIHFPDLDRRLDPCELGMTYALLALLGALFVVWIVLLGLALAGSSRQLSLLMHLTRRPWVIRFSTLANSFALALILPIAVLAFHATSMTRPSREGADVYFLYDEGVWVPRWAFALGLYRVSLQAERNWGKGCTVLDHLNKENLRKAFASGKVVILATHGQEGCAITYYAPEYLCVGAPDAGATDERNSSRFLRMKVLGRDDKWSKWEHVAVDGKLRLAYIFACYSGQRASQWEEHLAPAKVITYNRVSTVFDHAYWFAFTGPAELRRIQ